MSVILSGGTNRRWLFSERGIFTTSFGCMRWVEHTEISHDNFHLPSNDKLRHGLSLTACYISEVCFGVLSHRVTALTHENTIHIEFTGTTWNDDAGVDVRTVRSPTETLPPCSNFPEIFPTALVSESSVILRR